jgi:hypothetical protein
LGKRRPAAKPAPRAKPPRKASPAPVEEADPVQYGDTSLHDLFAQSLRTMLDSTDLDEEQKQGALLAASCPCCGAGSLSFTAKLKRRK